MSKVSEILTDTEARILEIYVKKERKEVIKDIETVIPMIDEPEMKDNCESLVLKLKAMDDKDFDELDL